MAEAGTESSTYRAFIAQESGNVSNDGFFNFPVLEQCLRSKGLICTPTTKSEVRPLMRDPSAQEAFICHLADHWFTLRRVRRSWWNLDSLKPAPRKVGAVYLEAFLLELQEKGYTVFLVRSATAPSPSATPDQTFLPPPDATRRERLRENQLYLDKAGRESPQHLQTDYNYNFIRPLLNDSMFGPRCNYTLALLTRWTYFLFSHPLLVIYQPV
eukprot:GHVT01072421.1.p1 GENE.GHVT01072421.1~~GHVT01072421.1.p1  ORF type:complete len:213 (+),score=23.28 GHVT01072421.1:197-835(+)